MESFLRRKTRCRLEQRRAEKTNAILTNARALNSMFNFVVEGGTLEIGEGSEVRQCTIYEGCTVKIGRGCTVTACVFKADTVIEDNCVLNRTEFYTQTDNKHHTCVIGKDSVLEGVEVTDTSFSGFANGGRLENSIVRNALLYNSDVRHAVVADGALMDVSSIGCEQSSYKMVNRIGPNALLINSCICHSDTWHLNNELWNFTVGSDLFMSDITLDFMSVNARVGDRLKAASGGLDSSNHLGHRATVNLLCKDVAIGDDVTILHPCINTRLYNYVNCRSICINSGTSVVATGMLDRANKLRVRSTGRYLEL